MNCLKNCKKECQEKLSKKPVKKSQKPFHKVKNWGRMIESCTFRSRQHKVASNYWNTVDSLFNGLTIIASGLTTGEAIAKMMPDYILVILGGISTISASMITFFSASSQATIHLQTAKNFETLRVNLIHCENSDDLQNLSKSYTEIIKDAPFLPWFLKEHRSKPVYYLNHTVLGNDITHNENIPKNITMNKLRWAVDIKNDPVCIDWCCFPKKFIKFICCIKTPESIKCTEKRPRRQQTRVPRRKKHLQVVEIDEIGIPIIT